MPKLLQIPIFGKYWRNSRLTKLQQGPQNLLQSLKNAHKPPPRGIVSVVSGKPVTFPILDDNAPPAPPANWQKGDNVIVSLALDDAQAKDKFGTIHPALPYY